jgi:predicted Zn finger-like uncharacterized protein
MSLTTRCPACATVFRVVPDQLKVSEGWVRCGRCSELFDARATLSPQVPVVSEVVEPAEAGEAAQVADTPEIQEVPEAAKVPEVPDLPEASEVLVALQAPEATRPGAPAAEDTPHKEETAQAVDASPAEPVLAADPPFDRETATTDMREPTWADTPGAAQVAAPGVSPGLTPGLATSGPIDFAPGQAAGTAPPDESLQVLDQVSFMRRARRHAFWRKPAVRAGLAVLAVVLALALGGQVAYEQRDELAQRVPVLTPLLSALCQPLQCRIGPPRRIESITIEASAFSRLQPDAFRLQFTLANAASMPVALPALELTLTDSQDQAVIRRVLQPTELGSDAPAALPAAGEWASAVTLTVAPAAAGAITGYRLLAFYP